jgi:DNA-binding CsgD family transcriptional regulator
MGAVYLIGLCVVLLFVGNNNVAGAVIYVSGEPDPDVRFSHGVRVLLARAAGDVIPRFCDSPASILVDLRGGLSWLAQYWRVAYPMTWVTAVVSDERSFVAAGVLGADEVVTVDGLGDGYVPGCPFMPTFSPRVRQCLLLMMQGFSLGEVAVLLGISLNTVKRHVRIASKLLGAGGTPNLLLAAKRSGLLGFAPTVRVCREFGLGEVVLDSRISGVIHNYANGVYVGTDAERRNSMDVLRRRLRTVCVQSQDLGCVLVSYQCRVGVNHWSVRRSPR